jgi:TPP-dependent pyruvate/acetoin dehydrogenase alpha subunit
MGCEKVGVLMAFVTVATPELAAVGLASGVMTLSAACTVSAAAVATCGSGVPEMGKLQDEINIAVARYNPMIFFMIFLQLNYFIFL